MIGADRVRVLNARSRFEIRWLVDRLHVGTSPRAGVAEFFRRLPASQRGRADRSMRRAFYAYALLVHARNRSTYVCLMRGTL